MSLGTFEVDGLAFNVVTREQWGGPNQLGGALFGAAWGYRVQSEDGTLFGFVVQYPMALGSNIETDNFERDIKMIEKAFAVDPVGVRKKGPTSQYEINTKHPPYSEILASGMWN